MLRHHLRWLVMSLAICVAGPAAHAFEAGLSVPGGNKELVSDIEGASLVLGLVDNDTATAQDILAAARADYARLVSVLYENGHYGGVIQIRVDGREAAGISPISGPTSVGTVAIRVDPGPRFTFSRASVGPLAPGETPPEGYATGRAARSGQIVNAAEAAVTGWRDAGHAKARVTDQQITANHPSSTLSSDIRLAPGPRLRFGDLVVRKDGGVRPNRVRQIAGLPTGDVFSPEDLQTASTRLRRTGAFRSVVLSESETIGPGDTLDIIASLEAAKQRRIGFGAELASLEGITLSGFWMHRNLLGGAERLRLEAEVGGIGGDSGGIDYLLLARFERPATFSPETDFFFGLRAEQSDEPEFRERLFRFGAGVTHRFNDELTGELGAAYQYTDVNDALGTRELQHFLIPGRLTYDSRDDPLDAKGGLFIDLEFMPFLGLQSGSGDGSRFYADARSYLAVGENKGIVFAGRAQIGSITGPSAASVPPGMLFFSGGAGTVRGQPFQSLGVDLPNGEQIGGRSFLAFAGEIRADVADQWAVVTFADAGFVGADSFGSENGEWHSGAGFGVRYKTALGPIRVDIGTPLDGDAGSDFELYIGIGQAF